MSIVNTIQKELTKPFEANELSSFDDGGKEVVTIKPQAIINRFNEVLGIGKYHLEITKRQLITNASGVPISVSVSGVLSVPSLGFTSPEVSKGWPVENYNVGNAYNAAESLLWPATSRFIGIGSENYLKEDIVPEKTLRVVGKSPVDAGKAITEGAVKQQGADKKEDDTPPAPVKVDYRILEFETLTDIAEMKAFVFNICGVTEEEFKVKTDTKRISEVKLKKYLEEFLDGKYEEIPPVNKLDFGSPEEEPSEEPEAQEEEPEVDVQGEEEDLGDPEEEENPFGNEENIWLDYLIPEERTKMEDGRKYFIEVKDIGKEGYEVDFIKYACQKLGADIEDVPQPLTKMLTFAAWCSDKWLDLIKEYKATLE